uniref:Ribonuclease H-like domain-containing protein n=1 Tax=Tanacetum cinerariifolium TaxID=118510 RepID=A0A699IKG1_TANCI|nr:ribonuclease H-like domain-containing protein [Tanacetum cinerariifolium]
MLKTRDYDLWSMRMEQYLTHTDYALLEVIINGDSPVPEPPAVGTVVPLKTKAQKLARKNESKAKSTLLLAIPDEHLLKFHPIKDAKSLWEAIKIRFRGNKESNKMHKPILKQQYENFFTSRSKGLEKTYDSINKTVNVVPDIPLVGSKEQLFVSSYADDVTIITMRVKKFMKKTRRNLNFNGKELVGFDKTRVECYNCHRRGHFARECHALRNQGNRSGDNERRVVLVETSADKANLEILGYEYGLESLEDRIHVHHKNKTVFEESTAFLKYDVHVRDISIKDLKNQLEKAIKEKYELKEKSSKFEESFKNLTKLINSQMSANDKTSLGYDSQLSKNEMPKCKIFEAASDSSVSEIDEDNNQEKDRYKVRIGYHAVLPPYTGNYMPPRADLSFAGLDDSVFKFKISETRTSVNENESIAAKSSKVIREEPKTVSSSAPIIEDWQSDSEDECDDKTSTE